METFIASLKNLARGKLSMRQFLTLVVSGAILWLIGTAFGGIVEAEAGNFWNYIQPFLQTPIPLWVSCSIFPLAVVLFFSIGVAMSGKFNPSNHQPDSEEIPSSNNEPLDFEENDTFLDEVPESPISSSTGELLSERTRVADGEISDSEFASHVLYWLNQKKINEKTAKRLLIGLRFEINVTSDGNYILVEKS